MTAPGIYRYEEFEKSNGDTLYQVFRNEVQLNGLIRDCLSCGESFHAVIIPKRGRPIARYYDKVSSAASWLFRNQGR